MTKAVARLVEQFQPDNYQIHLYPDPETMKFSGKVLIVGKKVGRPSQRITLHQKDLKFLSAKIRKISKNKNEELKVERINTQNSLDEVRIHAAEKIFPGEYELEIEFSGIITEQLHGLYPSTFKKNGEKNILLATQFESHHAREVFPCVDEPSAKSTFDLILTAKSTSTVLSNTPIKSVKKNKDLSETVFETTPKMSTYLLAFVIGDLISYSGKTKSGVAVTSWATTAQEKSHLKYSVDEAVKVLEFYEDYFGVKFPLEKCDQVALPDFDSGAMENWGLITYREILLLADPKNRSQTGEQYISLVIAHELSHQWFGNLVTMNWWDDLWLNESFASIMEYVCLDMLHPEWKMWEHFGESDMLAASSRDVTSNVQAVKSPVKHPDELFTLFDPAIVYAKGARLIKMLYDYIGEDAVRKGLISYFKEFKYSNTVSDDLWKHFAKASNRDIKSLMDPWLNNSGMPLISVNRREGNLILDQKRFLLDKSNDETIWPVPLLANPKQKIDLLDKKSLSLDNLSEEPVIINESGSTHAVVDYRDEKDKEKVRAALIDKSLSSVGRMNVLNDMYLLSRYGSQNLSDALDLVKKCKDEDRDSVWQLLTRLVNAARMFIEGDELSESKIREIKYDLAVDHYNRLGWDDNKKDDPNTKALRITMLSLMLQAEDKNAINEAKKRYKAAGKVANINSEQRGLILSSVVKYSSVDIDKLFAEYESTTSSDVQRSISLGLSSAKDVKVLEEVIERAIGVKGIARTQDITSWFAYLIRNQYSRDLAWNWLVTSWPRLKEKLGGNKSLDRFVTYSSSPLSTTEYLQKYDKFFTPEKNDIALGLPIKIALSEIKARIEWRNREEKPLKEYLKRLS